MPRLTDKDYLAFRAALRDDWFEHGRWTFAHLSPGEQMALHQYFAPTDDFTTAKVLEFRKRMSKLHPSLPQVAGRAYRQAELYLGRAPVPDLSVVPTKGKAERSKGKRRVKVNVVVRPKIDLARLAKIYFEIATEMVRREEAEAAKEAPSKKKKDQGKTA